MIANRALFPHYFPSIYRLFSLHFLLIFHGFFRPFTSVQPIGCLKNMQCIHKPKNKIYYNNTKIQNRKTEQKNSALQLKKNYTKSKKYINRNKHLVLMTPLGNHTKKMYVITEWDHFDPHPHRFFQDNFSETYWTQTKQHFLTKCTAHGNKGKKVI